MTLDDYAERIVSAYINSPFRSTLEQTLLPNLANSIRTDHDLKSLVHSLKYRTKDPEHLRQKLLRKRQKLLRGRNKVTPENLFQVVNDLAGMRLMHLHSKQIEPIDRALQRLLKENNCSLIEGPFVRTWDDESRSFYKRIGMSLEPSPNLYTSVHYVIAFNKKTTCEIQVRTLMEEVWGEIDHAINYPVPTASVACREQILALARATSSCSRLVDAIVASHAEHVKHAERKRSAATSRKATTVARKL